MRAGKCRLCSKNGVKSYLAQAYLKWNEVKVTQLCLTLCDSTDYTVQGILQARILEWVGVQFSRGSSQPRDQPQVSHTAGRFFISWATREAQEYWNGCPSPGDLLDPGIELGSAALQENSLPAEPPPFPHSVVLACGLIHLNFKFQY